MADKPASLPRDGTMEKTAAEGLAFLTNSNKSKKSKMSKHTTIQQTCKEAVAFCGDIRSSEGRTLRKRKSAPLQDKKPAKMKRAGTMAATARDGKDYLKRAKKGSKGAAAAAAEKKEKE